MTRPLSLLTMRIDFTLEKSENPSKHRMRAERGRWVNQDISFINFLLTIGSITAGVSFPLFSFSLLWDHLEKTQQQNNVTETRVTIPKYWISPNGPWSSFEPWLFMELKLLTLLSLFQSEVEINLWSLEIFVSDLQMSGHPFLIRPICIYR